MTNPAYFTEDGLARTISTATLDPSFPQYGYGIVQAVALAGALGCARIRALELGVAGGNGLVALQELSRLHSGPSGVDIGVAGVDLGIGMPEPLDYRDMPYVWQKSFYKMDEDALRQRLTSAELLIGDVGVVGSQLLNTEEPVGFIAFDLDYYSSTARAMSALLNASPDHYLPRVICYFDDTVGPHHEMHSELTGELLAINEFNFSHSDRKITKLNGLRYKILPNDGPWVEGIYVLHLLDHPKYCDYIYPVQDRQFLLNE